jgi:Flp pilus assembly protein TadG
MQRFVNNLVRSTRLSLQKFAADESGSILQMAGLSIIPLMLAAGVAIDTSRINYTHQKLAAGLDAGALAAAAMIGKSTDEKKVEARRYLDNNFLNGDKATIESFELTENDNEVFVQATARLPMSVMKAVGKNYADITLTSTIVKDGSSVEVALVLDNTGSMAPYMTTLKSAANEFLDTVLDKQPVAPYYARAAVIPYNRAVNLGTSANAARGAVPSSTSFTIFDGNVKSGDLTNCVSERTGTAKYTDASVASNPVGPVYIPSGSGNPCNISEVKGLTSAKEGLQTAVNAMTAGGSTAGQVGVAWGWYMVSPNFGLYPDGATPAPYGTAKLRKIVVLMTDGEYNSAYCGGVISSNGSTSKQLRTVFTKDQNDQWQGQNYYFGNKQNGGSGSVSEQAQCVPDNDSTYVGAPSYSKPSGMGSEEWTNVKTSSSRDRSVYVQSKSLCAAMKAQGVEVFTIEFQLDPNFPDRVDLASSCATDASHRVSASDGPSLTAAFKKIAASIGDPRVAK